MVEQPDGREATVREMLDGFVPDLLTAQKNELFVRNLFTAPQGQWHSVKTLCDGLAHAESFWESFLPLAECDLLVIWVEHPGPANEHGYVHFYLEDFFWTSSALYNLRRLTQLPPELHPPHQG